MHHYETKFKENLIRHSDWTIVAQQWRSCCDFFIRDWRESLPRDCGVDGLDFLRALLTDPDVGSPEEQRKLKVANCADRDNVASREDGDCSDTSLCLELMLLDLIRD